MRTSEAKAAMSEVIVTGDGGRATIVRESSDEQFDQLIDFIMDQAEREGILEKAISL